MAPMEGSRESLPVLADGIAGLSAWAIVVQNEKNLNGNTMIFSPVFQRCTMHVLRRRVNLSSSFEFALFPYSPFTVAWCIKGAMSAVEATWSETSTGLG